MLQTTMTDFWRLQVLGTTKNKDWREDKEELKSERKTAWKKKALHDQFLRETEGMQDQRRCQWIKAGKLKQGTGDRRRWRSTQNKCNKKWHWSPGRVPFMQALQKESWKCQPYFQFVFCPSWKPMQEETRQTWKIKHWLFCKKFEIECKDKLSLHQPEPVLDKSKRKILRDFGVQSDKEKELQRIDIAVIDKEKRECKIINIAILGDQKIKVKWLEKIVKYQELRLQVQIFWDVIVTVIPTVVDALGTVSWELENNLKTIGIPIVKIYLLKAGLLGRAFILRSLLGISESWKFSNVKAFF